MNLNLDQAPARSSDDVTNLATAFTRRGLVKHFWNLERIGRSAIWTKRRPILKLR